MTENEALKALKLEGGLEVTGKSLRVAQFFEGLSVAEQSLERIQKIQEIMINYEKTFAWGCNDSVHSAIAHAVYGVMTGKEDFLEEYQELLNELMR